MTNAFIASFILIVVSVIALQFAKQKAAKDIKVFSLILVGIFLLFGIVQEVRGDEPIVYVGVEAGLDWPQQSERSSPQCVDGRLTSDGRLYAGIEFTGPVYFEVDFWRHKSCALVDDSQVYDAFGVKIGARIEFDLFSTRSQN